MKIRVPGLWQNHSFVRLWFGETVSLFGTQVTLLALPLTAALLLEATPLEMGLLAAMAYLPFLLVGLVAGVWVDRVRRRPVLIAANLGRALLVGLIPILALLDVLRIEMLYGIGFLTGVLTVFFEVAYAAFLPAVVEREQLLEANSSVESSSAVASIAGPGLTGWLIGLLSAPVVIALDALSFLVSALLLSTLRAVEPAPASTRHGSVRAEVGEGLRTVTSHTLLRATVLCTATYNLFGNMLTAVYILYANRELGLSPTTIGLISSVGSVGALIGSIAARPLVQRFGIGPTMVAGIGLSGSGALLLPLSGELPSVAPLILAAGFLTQYAGMLLYNVNTISLRQAIIPARLLGRVTASIRFCVWGTLPFGSLIGGFLGQQIGLQPTLLVGAIGLCTAFLWVFFSPLLRLQHQVPTHV